MACGQTFKCTFNTSRNVSKIITAFYQQKLDLSKKLFLVNYERILYKTYIEEIWQICALSLSWEITIHFNPIKCSDGHLPLKHVLFQTTENNKDC